MAVFAPVIVQPDLERFVVEQLAPLGGGVTCFAYSAHQTEQAGLIWQHYVQVDARAGRKAAARDLAEQARQVVLGLPAVPWPGGTISLVMTEEGPMWMPDPGGGPRYCARYAIRVHPARGARQRAAGTPSQRALATAEPRHGSSAVPATGKAAS